MRPELPDDLAAAYLLRRSGRVHAVVRRDFAPAFDRLGLIAAADRAPADLAPRVVPYRPEGGRGELGVAPAGDLGEAVVRPFRRGGLVRHFVRRRYFLGARAVDELVLTRRLEKRGVPVAEPLAAVHAVRRAGYRAALVTRRVEGARPVPELLAEASVGAGSDPRPRELLARMGRSVGVLHRVGGAHPDLNAHNLLVPSDPEAPVVLLDFDRGRHFLGRTPRLRARWSLRRLRRSLRKLGHGSILEAWDAFDEAYRRALEAGPPA